MSLERLFKTPHANESEDAHWIPLSDLMTGLMMIFMLVALAFMIKVKAESAKVEEARRIAESRSDQMSNLAELYDQMREKLYRELLVEFESDLPRWKAKLTEDLAIRFEEPEVLFDTGSANLKPSFMRVIDNFFPRYVRILSDPKFRDSVEEVRIEGHTSSIWNVQTTADVAYFRNMELSQSRTRSVLQYALLLPQTANHKLWLAGRLTANGLSSSRPILRGDGTENRESSQRVEFRVRTNADSRIGDILKAARK